MKPHRCLPDGNRTGGLFLDTLGDWAKIEKINLDGLVKSPSAALRGNPAQLGKDLGSWEE
jgi:hypothetical protein